MNKVEKQDIKNRILEELKKTEEAILDYKESTKPISPENAIGRVSRMDAINNKSVVEAALRKAEEKLNKLMSKENIYSELKLISKVKTGNMHLINNLGVVQKYTSVNDIMKSFFNSRMEKVSKEAEKVQKGYSEVHELKRLRNSGVLTKKEYET